mmetsp:Transcript_36836/g.108631  ORF Transcript_36836/g.108631 Transcript_36836/m.108631 type:complete len:356 (-) Transcript_36836:489-1556(-)
MHVVCTPWVLSVPHGCCLSHMGVNLNYMRAHLPLAACLGRRGGSCLPASPRPAAVSAVLPHSTAVPAVPLLLLPLPMRAPRGIAPLSPPLRAAAACAGALCADALAADTSAPDRPLHGAGASSDPSLPARKPRSSSPCGALCCGARRCGEASASTAAHRALSSAAAAAASNPSCERCCWCCWEGGCGGALGWQLCALPPANAALSSCEKLEAWRGCEPHGVATPAASAARATPAAALPPPRRREYADTAGSPDGVATRMSASSPPPPSSFRSARRGGVSGDSRATCGSTSDTAVAVGAAAAASSSLQVPLVPPSPPPPLLRLLSLGRHAVRAKDGPSERVAATVPPSVAAANGGG